MSDVMQLQTYYSWFTVLRGSS